MQDEVMGYQLRLLLASQQIGMQEMRGRVMKATVFHEKWCKALKGRGPCSCVPDIVLECGSSTYLVDGSGKAHRVVAPTGGSSA